MTVRCAALGSLMALFLSTKSWGRALDSGESRSEPWVSFELPASREVTDLSPAISTEWGLSSLRPRVTATLNKTVTGQS